MSTSDKAHPPRVPPALLVHPAHLISFGFGSGLLRPAPGTWGSLAAMLPFVLWLQHLSPLAYWGVVLIGFGLGVWCARLSAQALGVHDHPAIVWDEFIGMWIVLGVCPQDWRWWLAAFALFRLCDIAKPWPVSWADRKVHGGLGIMLDDALAGVMAMLLVWVAKAFLLA